MTVTRVVKFDATRSRIGRTLDVCATCGKKIRVGRSGISREDKSECDECARVARDKSGRILNSDEVFFTNRGGA